MSAVQWVNRAVEAHAANPTAETQAEMDKAKTELEFLKKLALRQLMNEAVKRHTQGDL